MRDLLKNVVLIVLAIGIGLWLVEACLRYAGLGSPILYGKSALWGFSPLPNQQEVRLHNSRVSIDDNGFRVAEPFGKTNQIIFYGDSITYGGSYIDDKAIFSSVTCAQLKSNYTCANAGVNAYGIRNMLGRMAYTQITFPDASAVITVISDDFYRNFSQLTSLPYFATKPPKPFPAIMELLAFSFDKFRQWLRFSPTHYLSHPENMAEDSITLDEKMEADAVIAALKKSIDARRKEGKCTLIIWSPSRAWLEGKHSEREAYPKEQLALSGIAFTDMSDALQLSGLPGDVIYYDTAHLLEPGHEIYGKTIAAQFTKGCRNLH